MTSDKKNYLKKRLKVIWYQYQEICRKHKMAENLSQKLDHHPAVKKSHAFVITDHSYKDAKSKISLRRECLLTLLKLEFFVCEQNILSGASPRNHAKCDSWL